MNLQMGSFSNTVKQCTEAPATNQKITAVNVMKENKKLMTEF